MQQRLDISPETVEKSIELGRMLLSFGLTMRATHHEDGQTLESDTTHTVMLGIMASAFASEFAPHLDQGKIARFSLVHDLVEVYANDTPTFRIMSSEEISAKDAREAAALARIRTEFDGTFPWITRTIDEYDSLESAEARYVKVFDKVLPKIVHILNKGATARSLGHTKETTEAFHNHQYEKLAASYGKDQHEAMALFKAVTDSMGSADIYG